MEVVAFWIQALVDIKSCLSDAFVSLEVAGLVHVTYGIIHCGKVLLIALRNNRHDCIQTAWSRTLVLNTP